LIYATFFCKKLFGFKKSGIKKILRSGLKFTGLVKNPNNHETYNVEHTQWLKQKADERKQKFSQKPLPQAERKGWKVS